MFNVTIKKTSRITDEKKNFTIYKKDGNNYLQKNGITYILPNGNISGKNNEYFINDNIIDVETPERSYEAAV